MDVRKERIVSLREPSVAELLAEPIVRMVMAGDGVTASELRTLIAEAKARMELNRRCASRRSRAVVRNADALRGHALIVHDAEPSSLKLEPAA